MSLTLQRLIASDATREQVEEFCRREARSVSIPHCEDDIGPNLVLSRVLGKYLLYSLARDSAMTPHLALDGIWEPWVTMAIARHVKPGMRCLDVGACYGYFSLFMADLVGRDGFVDAWEPMHYEILHANVGLNGLPIALYPLAVGTALGVGTVRFVITPGVAGLFNAGGAALATSEFQTGVKSRFGVPSVQRYDFIKIDVEGAEADVWEALQLQLSQDGPTTVCMEFTPKQHEQPASFLRKVQEDGFALGTVGHDGYARRCSLEEALVPDTGDFRMLWLTKGVSA